MRRASSSISVTTCDLPTARIPSGDRLRATVTSLESSRGPSIHRRRVARVLLVAVVGLGLVAAPAVGQTRDAPSDSPPSDVEVFDPERSSPVPETQPEEEASDEPISTEDATMTEDEQVAEETVQQPGWGNASDTTPTEKYTLALHVAAFPSR